VKATIKTTCPRDCYDACGITGITVTLPKPSTSGAKSQGRFGKQDFAYLADEDVYRCPAGEKLRYYYTNEENGQKLRNYWTNACRHCALRQRIKNTLATVQALGTQTLSEPHQKGAFLARLRALGEAHDLLTMENWDRALLGDVVERALKPFQDGHADRIVAEGPPVWVAANNSLLLMMCLHELATNAAKYGPLSNGSGRVHVAWQDSAKSPGRVRLSWEESGGPRVAIPARKGSARY
jgi:two-component sensor histidine kinase